MLLDFVTRRAFTTGKFSCIYYTAITAIFRSIEVSVENVITEAIIINFEYNRIQKKFDLIFRRTV